MKMKYARSIAVIVLSTTVAAHDVKAEAVPKVEIEEKDKTIDLQQKERVYALMRQAAAYPVTNVAACIGGVKIAASIYADLLRQGALQSEEYTRFSIETQLKFAFENGTPLDMYAFRIVFEILRVNNAAWDEVSKNGGKDYAHQTALHEVITCKFNSGIVTKFPTGPVPKATIVNMVDAITKE